MFLLFNEKVWAVREKLEVFFSLTVDGELQFNLMPEVEVSKNALQFNLMPEVENVYKLNQIKKNLSKLGKI